MSAPLALLTDRSQLRLGRGLVRTVAECAAAGLTTVVVREHDLGPVAREALVARLARIDGLTVLSSRISSVAAHGVHLAADQPAPDGRPPAGRSCHDLAEVVAAVAEGASYVTLSPFAATASKPGHGPALSPATYAAARRATAGSGTRVLALGGVGPTEVGPALAAGAHGVAVMGAVMRAADPADVVRRLLDALAAGPCATGGAA